MQKHSSLAEQVQQAQQTFDSWTPARKSSVRLEGSSSVLTRFSPPQKDHQQAKAHGSKK